MGSLGFDYFLSSSFFFCFPGFFAALHAAGTWLLGAVAAAVAAVGVAVAAAASSLELALVVLGFQSAGKENIFKKIFLHFKKHEGWKKRHGPKALFKKGQFLIWKNSPAKVSFLCQLCLFLPESLSFRIQNPESRMLCCIEQVLNRDIK